MFIHTHLSRKPREVENISSEELWSRILSHYSGFYDVKMIEFSGLSEHNRSLTFGSKKHIYVEDMSKTIESGKTYCFDIENKSFYQVEYEDTKYKTLDKEVSDILKAHQEVKEHNEEMKIYNTKPLAIRMIHQIRKIFLNNEIENKPTSPKL